MELGYGPDDYDRIFMDTGWEHPFLYEYIDGPLSRAIGSITRLRKTVEISSELEIIAEEFERRLGVNYSAMVRRILRNAMFPNRMRRWCTQELKVDPAKAYVAENPNIVMVVGIRAQESSARALMLEWEWNGAMGCQVWRPIIDWTYEQVIECHQANGLSPCRLYLEQNANRVGCYPCIFAVKAELRAMSDFNQSRIDIIRDLEAILTPMMITKIEARGETVGDNFNGAGWFYREGGYQSIDKVIAWARTSRGGSVDQIELFSDPTGHQGCVRWGMCDTGSDNDL